MANRNCIPEDKHDIAAIERAMQVGFPKLNPLLPELLEWVQDSNWPVAPYTAELLLKAGPEIVPHIKNVLGSDDGMWKYWTIELVVANLSPDISAEIRDELVRLASEPTEDDLECEADQAAAYALDHAPKTAS